MKVVHVESHWSPKESIEIKFHDFVSINTSGVTSPAFNLCGQSWTLKLHPKVEEYDRHRHVQKRANCEIELKSSTRSSGINLTITDWSIRDNPATGRIRLGTTSAVGQQVDGSGTLTIKLSLKVRPIETRQWEKLEKYCGSERRATSFLHDLINAETGDVEFVLPDKSSMKAHSIFLSLRSPYFKELLESGDKGPIPVSFDRTVFEQLLHYIYTNEIPTTMISVDEVKGVLKVANHYQCYGLKHAAEIYLVRLLYRDNAVDLDTFAVAHCCPLLLEESASLIVHNLDKSRNSPHSRSSSLGASQ